MRKIDFRKANHADAASIWEILQAAIERRRMDGSNQWQDGYPNPDVIREDIDNGSAYVLCLEEEIVGYVALLINDEPEYDKIVGEWITNGNFAVFHRLAVAEKHLGKGLAKEMFRHIEEFTRENRINSVKADTNFDNPSMIHMFLKLGYQYCGEVYFRGSPRRAYEKVLS